MFLLGPKPNKTCFFVSGYDGEHSFIIGVQFVLRYLFWGCCNQKHVDLKQKHISQPWKLFFLGLIDLLFANMGIGQVTEKTLLIKIIYSYYSLPAS